MSDHTQAAGHAGCLMYARLAILLVFLANALAYVVEPGMVAMAGMLASAAAAGAAYVSQMLFNAYDGTADSSLDEISRETLFRRGQIAQIVSLAAAVASGLLALVAG